MKWHLIPLILCFSQVAAFDSNRCCLEAPPPAYRESIVYSKFDTFSRFFKNDMTENEIMTKYGLGWRYRSSHHGFNISVSGHEPREVIFKTVDLTDTVDIGQVLVYPDTTISGSYYYLNGQAMYLFYFNPDSCNSFYLGAGLEADRYNFHLNKTGSRLNMGFVSGILSAGYQFQICDNVKSYVELQAGQPAYIYAGTKGESTGLKPMNRWAPSFSLSIGIGF